MELKNANFVSIWDSGETIISTKCKFNEETNEVSDIEVAEVESMNLEILDEEYVEYGDSKIYDFVNLDE